MIHYIETFDNEGRQLLGSDFTTIVRDAKTQKKVANAIKRHRLRVENLKTIKPSLNNGYSIQVKNK